jgi:hypothetical protein
LYTFEASKHFQHTILILGQQIQHGKWLQPRWKWFFIGEVTALVIILVAVLGGVLGSRKGKSQTSAIVGSSNTTKSTAAVNIIAPAIRNIAAVSPIVAASSSLNVSTGYESWVEVLSLTWTGSEADSWPGAINNWSEQDNHLAPMSNITSKVFYLAVAVTAIGSAFAVTRLLGQNDTIASWALADVMLEWKSVGNVDIDTAWG